MCVINEAFVGKTLQFIIKVERSVSAFSNNFLLVNDFKRICDERLSVKSGVMFSKVSKNSFFVVINSTVELQRDRTRRFLTLTIRYCSNEHKIPVSHTNV